VRSDAAAAFSLDTRLGTLRLLNRKTSWTQWGLAVVVNLTAAIAAALAFGVWKRSQSPHVVAPFQEAGGFYELADDVGYIPRADARLRDRAVVDGRVVFDVVYRTGPDHFRVVPPAAADAEACALLFGDSFTFGYGVNDGETYAAQVVRKSEGRVAAHNFAVSGWGPHQFLAGLQSGRFPRAVRCRPTDAVYLMIPSHIWRAAGVVTPWGTTGPRYVLDAAGHPVRAGTQGDPAPFNWRRWIGLDAVSKADAFRLTKALLVAAKAELERLYPDIRMHILSYRVASWSDDDIGSDDMVAFEHELHRAGLPPLPLEAIVPRYRFAQRDYILDARDYHPNARAHHLIAEFLLREIRPNRD
jgi:hypothetical protein